MTKTYSVVTKDVGAVTKYINDGRVVAFPTGTSYGLAANALDGYALQRLGNMKGRDKEKTYTVFMADRIRDEYLEITDMEKKLLDAMAGKPLTLLVKPGDDLGHLSWEGLIGLRVIDHPLMKELADKALLPLTATSANRSGELSCYSAQEVLKSFPGKLPDELIEEEDPRGASGTTYDLSLAAVVDGGELEYRKATTIAKVADGEIEIIRAGELNKEELERLL